MTGAMIDKADLMRAVDAIEAVHPDAAVTMSTITNEHHMIHPFGAGIGITLHKRGQVVFEKGHNWASTMARAIARLDRRLAGDARAPSVCDAMINAVRAVIHVIKPELAESLAAVDAAAARAELAEARAKREAVAEGR